MTATPDNKDVYSRLERLERAVGNLQRQSTLSSASISGGNLTVRRGGSIRIIDGGSLIGEGDGNLDWEGNAHFGSDLLIDGNTNIEGTLGIGSNTTITGDTSITGQLDVTGQTELGGNTDITGELTVGGDTEITGQLDVTGDTHFSGDLLIDGTTTLGGNLTFAPGVVPPEALSYRAEARTFSHGETTGQTNTYSASTSVPVPSWATTTSCTVTASVYGSLTGDATRIGARTNIAGNNGDFTHGIAYVSELSIPSVHGRTFSPSGSFNVTVSGGASPVSAEPVWTVNMVILCIFTNQ